MGQYIDFAYVKALADFPAVLDHYKVEHSDPKNGSHEMRANCPFHDDVNPSLSINTDRNLFHCHAASCGVKGNVLEFVAEMEGTALREAAKKLADICGIDLAPPKRRGNAKPTKEKSARKAKTKAEHQARQYDEDNQVNQDIIDKENGAAELKSAAMKRTRTGNEPLSFRLQLDPTHEYGAERALSNGTIDRFEMGYCTRGMMKGRWCVPVHNAEGELVAYIGRWAGEDRPKDEPKYKLPPKFDKSLVLFNLHRVLAARQNEVALVEGVFDAIRLHELGIPAVALLGSSISDEQAALLSGMACVHVMFDGGADKARCKVVDRLAQDCFVRSVILPENEDPASVDAGYIIGKVPEFVG